MISFCRLLMVITPVYRTKFSPFLRETIEFAINPDSVIVECRGYHNRVISYSNWSRLRPDDAKLPKAVPITVRLREPLKLL